MWGGGLIINKQKKHHCHISGLNFKKKTIGGEGGPTLKTLFWFALTIVNQYLL